MVPSGGSLPPTVVCVPPRLSGEIGPDSHSEAPVMGGPHPGVSPARASSGSDRLETKRPTPVLDVSPSLLRCVDHSGPISDSVR
jgi:hypothetical protein